ncbi:hypothetical protein BCV70DRAFT_154463 [Testicularia cyperi]|uniref:Uncharacterized protein n=1 Tax=Testicularia cyperi TaxID=1882483 RepID=A0A317Y0R1_9BASI|nr:hypothetical protein BCV70DRAFT_154463 [Testicularia cyperi]
MSDINAGRSGSSAKGRGVNGRAGAGTLSSSFIGLKAELERAKTAYSANAGSSSSSKCKDPFDQVADQERKRKNRSWRDELLDDRASSRRPSSRSGSQRPSARDSRKERSRGNNTDKIAKRTEGKSDSQTAATPTKAQLEAIRRNLERKAKIYAQLSEGRYGGLSDEQLKDSSIDWDRKLLERQDDDRIAAHSRSPSPPPHASSKPLGDSSRLHEDPDRVVEYIDEFGRTRTARLSDVPREFLDQFSGDTKESEESDTPIYGPATSFPVYTPKPRTPARANLETHFDATLEQATRQRGAAFYHFSTDERERVSQMDQLAALRAETISKRTDKSRSSPLPGSNSRS